MAQKYTRSVATNMVIANMIGTGIFTSLGFQVLPADSGGIPDPFAILVIWLLGGIVSLCGATVYGEVATRINRSGGEYAFLSDIYHPILGFISGWISLFVGFSAAIASLALATGEYLLPAFGVTDELTVIGIPVVKLIAAIVIIVVAAIQLTGVKSGGIFQNVMTFVKIGLVLVFLAIPFIFMGSYEGSGVSFAPTDKSTDTIFSVGFAGALVWVMFAYSGWNASSYIVGNMENPKRNLPFSLVVGTIIVTILYMCLNSVFMYVATFDELALQVDLGNVVANKVLGSKVGLIFSLVFSIALISGVSAMFIAGPRVVQQIGKDYSVFRFLGRETGKGAPSVAIMTITVVAIVMIFTVTFSELIQFIGFTLSVFSLLTVIGIFVLRSKKSVNTETDQQVIDSPDGKNSGERIVKAFAYPVTPIIFIAVTIWMMSYFAIDKPIIILWFFIAISPAVIIFVFTRSKNETNSDSNSNSPDND